MKRIILLTASHLIVLLIGFAAGIYALPILTAPDSPAAEQLSDARTNAVFTGEFRRDLEDSDALHYGDGTLYVGRDVISFEGKLSPGPDFRLYLSPEFVETEADFEALKSEMVQVGLVQTFEDFMVAVPADVDPAEYTAAIVWCESFGQFISAASYR